MNPTRKKSPSKPSGRRYSSVADLLRGQNVCEKMQEDVASRSDEKKIATLLASMRAQAGMTQEELAEKIGRTQGSVSKIENTPDRDITLGIIQDYSKATAHRVSFTCGKPMNHVEAVKNNAFSMRRHLEALASIAQKHDELQPHIQGFFGEAFFNIMTILSECQNQMPKTREDFEILLTDMEENAVSAHPRARKCLLA
jgi:transcriptional regulator with XRE-family HTH domain